MPRVTWSSAVSDVEREELDVETGRWVSRIWVGKEKMRWSGGRREYRDLGEARGGREASMPGVRVAGSGSVAERDGAFGDEVFEVEGFTREGDGMFFGNGGTGSLNFAISS